MENNANKTGKGLIIVIILLVLIILGLVGYICYDKGIILNTKITNKTEKIVDNDEKTSDEQKIQSQETSKCYGTYYGEYSDTSNTNLTTNLKYTYVLNDDGTFTADFGGVSATEGTFIINDNTISLTSRREVVGPREESPYYETKDFVIADDCSYILYTNQEEVGTIQFKLNKQ